MTRGTRIVAVDADTPQGVEIASTTEIETAAEAEASADDWWEEPAPAPRRPWLAIIAGTFAVLAIGGWTTLFAMANLAEMQTGGTLQQWTTWVRDWSAPVLLVAVAWLVAMRNSRREALRFGETARLLGDESARLEERLTTVNRELSLAREFISAQSRDIDALGRVATERLSQHADKLAGLIQDNGSRIDAIGDVSTAALENMEKLRGQLPVIASSAKDVTNNIAAAGRTAHSQVEDLVAGFNKLNQFGQASERQVTSLRSLVEETVGEFTLQADKLKEIAEARFAALGEQGAEFRAQLDAQEVEALAAIRTRATALSDELEGTRSQLDEHEAESLTSLRARLSAVRDESAALIRALRDGEVDALEIWKNAIAGLETDLRTAITQVGEIDQKAMESARKRLAELEREAEQVDARISERDQLFAAELERRNAEFDTRHARFIEQVGTQMAALDEAAGRHREIQDNHASAMAERSEQLSTRLSELAETMVGIGEQSGQVETRLAQSIENLSAKLASSRDALAGTDKAVEVLTDNSVRLLELIQASVQHTSNELPHAMSVGEARLAEVEARVTKLRDVAEEAARKGEVLAGHAKESSGSLTEALDQVASLHSQINEEGARQEANIAALKAALESVRAESLALAEQAQGELGKAIAELNQSAHEAIGGIETMSASSIAGLANRIGAESAAAIDKAMRERTAEVAGQLESATARAAGSGREAAIALRDQLAKVNELAGALEQRIAHARSRAEEQVDNDFARRVALITEGLNSNAIDIARALDTDVTDTAWAAYLKGDRGIFTRRAVKLLETPEAKAVAQIYENDREFRDHVSRYIHDFEAMLRQLLSTRDGHALGVTLLSSDMGKLYVALAQSIERLRN
ncbi:ATPase [Novosphingobium sp.]|uniref:ATPase n=1 Tax=Novosphingobium sp. TaxID=1874826 RepID=UPI0025ECED2C|nr:ATPase [Novosphingobium sp.]MCC6925596.1 ATPase [Novosphingobium sp.]